MPVSGAALGGCVPRLPGCVLSQAINYNPVANVDDGSCDLGGCTNEVTHQPYSHPLPPLPHLTYLISPTLPTYLTSPALRPSPHVNHLTHLPCSPTSRHLPHSPALRTSLTHPPPLLRCSYLLCSYLLCSYLLCSYLPCSHLCIFIYRTRPTTSRGPCTTTTPASWGWAAAPTPSQSTTTRRRNPHS